MARTIAGLRLTTAQRRAQLAIRARALRDLAGLWRVVDPTNLRGTFGSFLPGAVAVTQSRRAESARSAADYYERFARAEGVEPIPPLRGDDVLDDVLAQALSGAGLGGIVNARRAGFSPQAAARNGLVKLQGTATEMVLDGGRKTIAATSSADGQALGWRRVTDADPCSFCREMAAGIDNG